MRGAARNQTAWLLGCFAQGYRRFLGRDEHLVRWGLKVRVGTGTWTWTGPDWFPVPLLCESVTWAPTWRSLSTVNILCICRPPCLRETAWLCLRFFTYPDPAALCTALASPPRSAEKAPRSSYAAIHPGAVTRRCAVALAGRAIQDNRQPPPLHTTD